MFRNDMEDMFLNMCGKLRMNIEELREKIKEIQKQIEELKNKKENKRWRADENETYWYLNSRLNPSEDYEHLSLVDENLRYKYRNYFKTEEEAQAVADNIKTHIELIELAEELNTEPIDWKNNTQLKYSLGYQYARNSIIDSNYPTIRKANTIYCTNYKFKDEAVKRIGEERLIKYLKGE